MWSLLQRHAEVSYPILDCHEIMVIKFDATTNGQKAISEMTLALNAKGKYLNRNGNIQGKRTGV